MEKMGVSSSARARRIKGCDRGKSTRETDEERPAGNGPKVDAHMQFLPNPPTSPIQLDLTRSRTPDVRQRYREKYVMQIGGAAGHDGVCGRLPNLCKLETRELPVGFGSRF